MGNSCSCIDKVLEPAEFFFKREEYEENQKCK